MPEDAKLKLTFRLTPADGEPADPVVLDDIVRLILQGEATAPPQAERTTAPAAGFRDPDGDDRRTLRALESKIESRIQAASAASQAAVEQRAATAALSDGQQRLADEALEAARQLVAAVQRAVIRGVSVRVPDEPPAGPV